MKKIVFESNKDKVFFILEIVFCFLNVVFLSGIVAHVSSALYRKTHPTNLYYLSLDFEAYNNIHNQGRGNWDKKDLMLGNLSNAKNFETFNTTSGICAGYSYFRNSYYYYELTYTSWDYNSTILLINIENVGNNVTTIQDYCGNVFVCDNSNDLYYRYNLSDDVLTSVSHDNVVEKKQDINYVSKSFLSFCFQLNNIEYEINPIDYSEDIYEKMMKWKFEPCSLILYGDTYVVANYRMPGTDYFIFFSYNTATNALSFERIIYSNYELTPIIDVPIKKWEDLLNS